MGIDQNTIDDVISRTDIVIILGKYLKLRRSGHTYFACCPFHNEKSASFAINSQKQFFHCFGCGESGNVITFIMKYNGLSFIEAVKELAHEAGVHIANSAIKLDHAQIKKQKEHKQSVQDTLNTVVKFYQQKLITSVAASSYLKNRGITQNSVTQFLIGYAPNDSMTLAHVINNYQQNQLLRETGLVIDKDNGETFDRFRDRIMFPIRNTKGEVIGFGGRVINKGEPKYLNSPETTLFNKSQELYGLFEAQKSIRDKKFVIVVEGYMDVIALAEHGVTNVVATMGTAATEEHIKKLFRFCPDIYYCFDGDKAGQSAAWRALERSVPLITDTNASHFLFLPQEHDPDSYIRKFGADNFIDKLKRDSLPLSAYLLNQLSKEVNLNTEEGKARLISLIKPFIDNTKAIALQVMLKKQLAKMVSLEPNVLESILNNRSRYAFFTRAWKKTVNKLIPQQQIAIASHKINVVIKHGISNIAWIRNYCLPEDISLLPVTIQELALLFDHIDNHYDVNDHIDTEQLQQILQLTQINLDKIMVESNTNPCNEEEFRHILDGLFGVRKLKSNKIPNIPMREKL